MTTDERTTTLAEDPESRRSALVWGIGLVLVGSVLAAAKLDIVDLAPLAPWWPLLVIAGGVVHALRCKGAGSKRVRYGLWFVGIGLWLLVSTLGLWGFDFSDSWPFVVIVAGVVGLVAPEDADDRAGALFPLFIGLWLLVNTRELWGLDWGSSWPLLLVLVGIAIVVKGVALARGRGR